MTKKRNILGSIGIASILGQNPYYREMAQQAILWEKRFAAYSRNYPEKPEDYKNTLTFYETLVQMAHSLSKEQSPERVVRVNTENGFIWLTAKEAAEEIAKKPLPDIDPHDAIELGKTTPFSAEEWYRGCTEKLFLG